jgi:hypothetical protein
MGMDLRKSIDIAAGVIAFITASFLNEPVTLRASGPRHWCHA